MEKWQVFMAGFYLGMMFLACLLAFVRNGKGRQE